MQTYRTTSQPKAEPPQYELGAYVQVEVPFAYGKVWLIGRIIDRDIAAGVVTVHVSGGDRGRNITIETFRESARLKPFVATR